MTTIVAIGDNFILPSILEQVLRQHLEGICVDLSLVLAKENWPEEPLMFNDEVKEFVGDPDDLAEVCSNADAIVTHVAPVTRSMMYRAKSLKIIGCCRGGPINVNVEAASERGVPVIYTPGRNARAVVEFTVGLILAEFKGICRAHNALSHGKWLGDLYRYDRAPRELHGKTVGLIGFGVIAQMLVPCLQPFSVHILAYDPYVSPDKFDALNVERCELRKLLAESDIISLHARVTKETMGMIGEKEIREMKPGAILINTARGPLVDYEALFHALDEKHLAGAGLDCFSDEPPPESWPLLKLDNVTLTPHIAGSTKETAHNSAEIIARDLRNYFSAKPLRHCINPQVLLRELNSRK
jgi:D-3-phosphoglycerate dehydrogenase / 2-oxoglutarate reductase